MPDTVLSHFVPAQIRSRLILPSPISDCPNLDSTNLSTPPVTVLSRLSFIEKVSAARSLNHSALSSLFNSGESVKDIKEHDHALQKKLQSTVKAGFEESRMLACKPHMLTGVMVCGDV